MIEFTIYNNEGEILRSGFSTEPLSQLGENEYIIIGKKYNPSTETIIIKDEKIEVGKKDIRDLEFNDNMNTLRKIRNDLLAKSDWILMPDSPVLNKEEWKEYRKKLRNLPRNVKDPLNVDWPEQPKVLQR